MNPKTFMTATFLIAIAIAFFSAFSQASGAAADDAASPAARAHDVRASRLLGVLVEDREGQRRGELVDLLVDPAGQRVTHVVVDIGGVFGVGEHRIAVPLERVQGPIVHSHLAIDMSARELREAPEYRPERWRERLVSAERLLHADLRDRQDRDVGDFDDMVLDLDSGRIRCGVARFDPTWSASPRRVVLEPSQSSVQRRGDELVVVASRADLRAAPTFRPQPLRAASIR